MRLLSTYRENWVPALREDFKAYGVGPFSEGYSAIAEVHYPPKRVFHGPWSEISAHHSWNARHNPDSPNWWIVEEAGSKVLRQTVENRLGKTNWKHHIKRLLGMPRIRSVLAFPALSAGDASWFDYCVCAEVKPLSKNDWVGLIFCMNNAQDHYAFCLKKDRALLIRRSPNDLTIVADSRFRYACDQYYELTVATSKGRVQCFINGMEILDVEDAELKSGKIGLMANVPAICRKVEVFIDPDSFRNYETEKRTSRKKAETLKDQFPQMRLSKKLRIDHLCSGRTIRIGDLSGDRRPDLLLAQGKPMSPGDNFNMITCLTAMDFDGNILWQKGEASKEDLCFCSDLALQIHDIDGDGLNEVICTTHFYIEILDGRNGQVKQRIPTPRAASPHAKFERIVGDAIYVCNLSDAGGCREFLLKDRYSKIWAFDNKLQLLWEYESKGEMGHFPYSMDINNDGKDEILIGYSLLDCEGRRLWELPLTDHADASAILKVPGSDRFVIIIAGSDEGLIFADLNGRIQRQLFLGHAQTVTVARLLPEREDYQVATNTYWGNPGIIYVLDLEGNLIKSFQPSVYGSPICPVNWVGDGREFLLLSAAPDRTGGLYDGSGNQAVSFPDDGHPTLCSNAFDLNGDGIDELLCWDHASLWIYEREAWPRGSAILIPKRTPQHFNASNYRSNVSIFS